MNAALVAVVHLVVLAWVVAVLGYSLWLWLAIARALLVGVGPFAVVDRPVTRPVPAWRTGRPQRAARGRTARGGPGRTRSGRHVGGLCALPHRRRAAVAA